MWIKALVVPWIETSDYIKTKLEIRADVKVEQWMERKKQRQIYTTITKRNLYNGELSSLLELFLGCLKIWNNMW